jgi:hypothetical protein
LGVQRDRCQSGHYIDAASKAQSRELGKHRESSKQPQPRERERERERKGFDRAPTRGGRKGFERAPTRGGRKSFERDTQGRRGGGDSGFNYYTLGGLTSGLQGYLLYKSKKCYLGTFCCKEFHPKLIILF